MTIIPIVIGDLGTVTKGLIQRTGGLGKKRTREDHLNYCKLRSARILRVLSLKLHWKPSINADVKNSQGIIIIMHNPAPALENDTHKLLWDFDIQTDHLISARRPDLIIINKKKKRKFAKLSILLSRLTTEPADHRTTQRMWKEG